VVLIEIYDRSAGSVIEELIVIEFADETVIQRVENVVGELSDGVTGIRETCNAGNQRQPPRNIGNVHTKREE
jgi:hypothetical protein